MVKAKVYLLHQLYLYVAGKTGNVRACANSSVKNAGDETLRASTRKALRQQMTTSPFVRKSTANTTAQTPRPSHLPKTTGAQISENTMRTIRRILRRLWCSIRCRPIVAKSSALTTSRPCWKAVGMMYHRLVRRQITYTPRHRTRRHKPRQRGHDTSFRTREGTVLRWKTGGRHM